MSMLGIRSLKGRLDRYLMSKGLGCELLLGKTNGRNRLVGKMPMGVRRPDQVGRSR